MKKDKLSASIMCADLMNMESQINQLEKSGIDFLHIDLIDNSFAPNLTFGPDFVKQLRMITDLPFELHYMVKSPQSIIESLLDDKIKNTHIIHLGINESVNEISSIVKMKGDSFGVALLPVETVGILEEYLEFIDEVLLLSVIPGFAGSPFIESSYERARSIVKLIGERNIDFCVDGAMSVKRCVKMSEIGANIFVGGTSSIFNTEGSIVENVRGLRNFLIN